MSYEEYWEKECTLVKSYREAYKLKQKQLNQSAWLQGMYFYEALCDVSPILHAFAKNGTKPNKYSQKPYEFEVAQTEEEKEIKIEKEQLKAQLWMNNFIRKFKAGAENGN